MTIPAPALPVFPESGPYRVDQVMAHPQLMAGLFLLQLLLAGLIQWCATTERRRAFRWACGLLLGAVFTFFLLAGWGIGDVNRLSHVLVKDPLYFGLREPLWIGIAPLVRVLPYRFASVHAALAVGYASVGLLLAARLGVRPWAGWWALFLVCHPFLGNVLQGGVTRQGLATLLLLPLFLAAAGLLAIRPRRVAAATVLALIAHSSFPAGLALAISPLLLRGRAAWSRVGHLVRRLPRPSRRALRPAHLLLLLAAAVAAGWVLLSFGSAWDKLLDYLHDQDYFPSTLLSAAVGRVQAAMMICVLMTCWRRKLDWPALRRDPGSRLLLAGFLLLVLSQICIAHQWLPQIVSRFQDAIGLYLLVVFLIWLVRRRVTVLSLLPILTVFAYWLFEVILPSGSLHCGLNDEFLCLPDRLPWQVVYWR